MAESIRHTGIVVAIDEPHIKVRIVQTSACAGCRIAGHCNASESKTKEVDVYDSEASKRLNVGDQVVVSASRAIAAKAMLYGFGLPLVVMLVAIVVASALTDSETIAAGVALGLLAPYYIALYLFNNKIGAKVAFGIERQN